MNLKHQWYECPVGPFPGANDPPSWVNDNPSNLDRLLSKLEGPVLGIATDGKRWGVKVMVPR